MDLQLDTKINEMLSLQHHKTEVLPETSTKASESVEKGDMEQRSVLVIT